jgi:hypothetical protein
MLKAGAATGPVKGLLVLTYLKFIIKINLT